MQDSYILNSPILIILFSCMFFLCLFSCFKKMGNGIGIWISMSCVIGGLTYALIMGASLTECALVCLVFFLLLLVNYTRKGDKEK